MIRNIPRRVLQGNGAVNTAQQDITSTWRDWRVVMRP